MSDDDHKTPMGVDRPTRSWKYCVEKLCTVCRAKGFFWGRRVPRPHVRKCYCIFYQFRFLLTHVQHSSACGTTTWGVASQLPFSGQPNELTPGVTGYALVVAPPSHGKGAEKVDLPPPSTL